MNNSHWIESKRFIHLYQQGKTRLWLFSLFLIPLFIVVITTLGNFERNGALGGQDYAVILFTILFTFGVIALLRYSRKQVIKFDKMRNVIIFKGIRRNYSDIINISTQHIVESHSDPSNSSNPKYKIDTYLTYLVLNDDKKILAIKSFSADFSKKISENIAKELDVKLIDLNINC